MRACSSGALLVVLALSAGCGGQGPSAPSQLTPTTSSPLNIAGTQSLVAAAVNQAAMNTAMTVSPDGRSSTVTIPCADGGSISVTMTFSPTSPGTSGPLTSSSRMEFGNCRNQTVTINGDPAIMMDGTYTFVTTGNTLSSMTALTRMTGGLRFDTAGTAGRARYDCTMTMSMQFSDGTPMQPTVTATGTITWEQPLGTVSVRSCGP